MVAVELVVLYLPTSASSATTSIAIFAAVLLCKPKMFAFTLVFFLCIATIRSFHLQSSSHRISKLINLRMHFEEALIGNTALTTSSLPRERYVATNRFVVRNNQDPKFEKRWADRKSRLAKLEGFRFFTLLRRVESDGVVYDDDLGNYISLTIWEDKKHFDAWRTGEAFKEAHGGGGIGDFMQLLSTALFILKGSPKPAFYDGLLMKPGTYNLGFATDEGWRQVNADGKTLLPTDVFAVQTRYNVDDKQCQVFEKTMKESEDLMAGYDGYAGSFVMRRDASKADDGYNYIHMSIWKDKQSYDSFKTIAKPLAADLAVARSPAFYEGKLALNSARGM
jgi:heme-degrading monooxygenase HmoA